MTVAVLINNYNYGRYVGGAIESALAQTYRDVRVVVVDDGSTDDSWEVICGFGSRIKALRQENGGQGAAYNTGWRLNDADFVLFLDADDLLEPDAIERGVEAMRSADSDTPVAMVSWPLRLIDRNGQAKGGATPYLMHAGDVTPVIRRFGHYAGPPASGNLFRSSAIAPMFPLDATQWRRAADTVPFIAAPFAGRVKAISTPLGAYRLHRQASLGVFGNIDSSLRSALLIAEHRRLAMAAILRSQLGIELPGPFLPLPWMLRVRALSWRLDREQHPFAEDDAQRIIALTRQVLDEWPGYLPIERLLIKSWVRASLYLPRRVLHPMAATATSSTAKAAVKRLLGGAR
jgi:hypothetical protein